MTASISFQDKSSGKVCVERVKTFDFNCNGMSIETNLDLEIEGKISLNISKERYHASNVICTVFNMVKQGDKKQVWIAIRFRCK